MLYLGLLFHLIWKNYLLYWDFDLKIWIMDFFTRFTCEKPPQNNFSRQNCGVENSYLFIVHHFYISRELCFATTTSSNSILEMHSAMTVKNRWPRRRRKNSSKWIYYSHLWIFYIHWHLCKILWRPIITMCRKTIKTLMMVFLSRFGCNVIPLNITIGKNCIFLGITIFKPLFRNKRFMLDEMT